MVTPIENAHGQIADLSQLKNKTASQQYQWTKLPQPWDLQDQNMDFFSFFNLDPVQLAPLSPFQDGNILNAVDL